MWISFIFWIGVVFLMLGQIAVDGDHLTLFSTTAKDIDF